MTFSLAANLSPKPLDNKSRARRASQAQKIAVRSAGFGYSARSRSPANIRRAYQGGPMAQVPITIACGNYDRTKAIIDGRVKVDGCAINYLPLYPEEIFHRAFKFQEFDVTELSFSSYLRTLDTSAYIGIPAFVSRIFRHSGIYIRTDAGIKTPADLRGKRIGLPEYQITAVVWMRG